MRKLKAKDVMSLAPGYTRHKSLYYTPETNMILYANYTGIEIKNLMKKVRTQDTDMSL